ncbi:MAG: phospho-N-acetylmuramoyl-pentapeptide-transferase [Bacillota bacterium]|nr:phospho-N-acetylmuramoyl-pentapeptide-transferase [Bacillota bacterium]
MFWKLLIPAVAALLLTALLGYILLPVLIRLKVGQSIRKEGPQAHLRKAGTPTMGGVIFVPVMVLLCFFIPDKHPSMGLWLFSFLGFGLIGFLDDWAKLRHHENQGLLGKQKLLGQFVAVSILLWVNSLIDPNPTAIYLFGADPFLDLGWFYYPLMAILMVGMVNAVNLTDGLDGLVSGVSVPVFFGFLLLLAFGSIATEGGGLSMVSAGLIGCCLGFLLYNHYPARVFMGDTGSMALGGAVVGLAVAGNLELLMIGLGLVYLVEALSVMLQVGYYKMYRKRLFRMAPLHHHFELLGRKEKEVTALFCLVSAACVLLTLLLERLF